MNKNIFLIFIIMILIVSVSFAGGKGETSSHKNKIRIALVTDTGGIDDTSFNQSTWEGIQRFEEEYKEKVNVDIIYIQSESDADYVPNLTTVIDEGYQLVVAPGFLFTESITEISSYYPDTHFLIIDTVVGERDNVASAIFSEQEGSFLVGIAAAIQAQKDGVKKVGFIGGVDFDVIQRFEAGFEAGVKALDTSIEVVVEYAGDFANPQIGQTIATKMYNSGITVIFHAAGATGNGLIKEAKDRAIQNNEVSVWAIGVDRDQYQDGIYNTDTKQSVVLTSMVKRVDIPAYKVAIQEAKGEFQGGQILSFDLAKEGVGLPESNPNLDNNTLSVISEWKEKIKTGAYKVPTLPTRLQ